MSSYAHDAEVLVYNYQTRATEKGPLSGFSIGGSKPDPMATTTVSLREAITSISIEKAKGNPQGTFMITLKPTKEWTKILVPGSWCSIFMSDKSLTQADLNNKAATEKDGSITSPLKMIGIIMAVRVQKQVDGNGAVTLTYSISGYDFGYVFSASIYINHVFQADVNAGILRGPLSQLSFPKDREAYADPAVNVTRVLQAWSLMEGAQTITFATDTSPPPIRMELPKAVTELVGTGKDVLQFVNTVIGVDKRKSKVVSEGDKDGISSDFIHDLVGEKFFMVWQLIVNNSLWGMINQYLNPTLNEAYTDLHVVRSATGSLTVRPMLVVRQIPFNTPDYAKYWESQKRDGAASAPTMYPVTNYADLPRTILPEVKVLNYDIGYSDYDRVNFVEVNGFDIDSARNSPGAFNSVNRPRFEEGSIRRFGLRTKVLFGADYGGVRGNIAETGYWSPLLMDWWFNGNRYANGTIECVGLGHHIAVGENVQLSSEKILGHIEGYTHNFHVDENGNRIFRTTISFCRGINSDSNATQFKYVYGDANFGGDALISSGVAGSKPIPQDASIFEDDVERRVTYTELRKIPTK